VVGSPLFFGSFLESGDGVGHVGLSRTAGDGGKPPDARHPRQKWHFPLPRYLAKDVQCCHQIFAFQIFISIGSM